MPKVLDQLDRDRAIWEEYVAGRRQIDIAQDRGLAQSTIAASIARYRAQLPPLDRAEELDRTLDLINALIHVHVPRAMAGHLGHTRMVDRLANTKAKLAGIAAPTKVQHEGQIDHAHTWTPGPSVAEVLDQWRAQGVIQGELTRMDT